MYIDGDPVLHVVDEATRFQAARWLRNLSAKHTWETLRHCWIDTYTGPPDYIFHDAGKNFASREFRQYAAVMATVTKGVPVEAHWSIGIVERAHPLLRRAYKIIAEELKDESISKNLILQMAVKSVNDTAGPDGLIPTLLVFGAPMGKATKVERGVHIGKLNTARVLWKKAGACPDAPGCARMMIIMQV